MHLGPPLWVLVLMTIAIELLIRFNELKQVILYGNVKGMVGDPPIQREGFLAPQEIVITFISFVKELGMPYYQEGCHIWT